jgi:hypothetical protein
MVAGKLQHLAEHGGESLQQAHQFGSVNVAFVVVHTFAYLKYYE